MVSKLSHRPELTALRLEGKTPPSSMCWVFITSDFSKCYIGIKVDTNTVLVLLRVVSLRGQPCVVHKCLKYVLTFGIDVSDLKSASEFV